MKFYRLEAPTTGEALDLPWYLSLTQARAAAFKLQGGAIVVESPDGEFSGAQGPWRALEWACGRWHAPEVLVKVGGEL